MTGYNQIPGYILHRRLYRESSLIIDIFTRHYGRVTLIAKGGRKNKHHNTILQPFRLIQFSWLGRSELKTMVSAEPVSPLLPITGRLLFCGLYLNELLITLLGKEDEHDTVFLLYESTLAALAGGSSIEKSLRLFEITLLSEIGYGLQLDQEADSGKTIFPEKRYLYQVDKGPVESRASTGTVLGATLIGLRQLHFDNECTLREAKFLMRKVIDYHLGGKPLKSRQLFQPQSK